MFLNNHKNSMLFMAACAMAALLLLLLCSSCSRAEEEIVIEQLTPEEVLDYIEIFKLDCDLSDEDILSGKDYNLTATEETEDFLFRLNFFTGALHPKGEPGFGLDHMSEDFRDAYLQGVEAKRKYTGHLWEHWNRVDPFLDIKHVEHYPAELYRFYKALPEEIRYRLTIDKDGLSLPQYLDFICLYALEWSEGPWLDYDGTGTLAANDWKSMDGLDKAEFLSQLLMENETQKQIAAEYDITESTPMEFSWVLNHPKKAYEVLIQSGLFREYQIFHVSDRITSESNLQAIGIPFFPPEEKEVN